MKKQSDSSTWNRFHKPYLGPIARHVKRRTRPCRVRNDLAVSGVQCLALSFRLHCNQRRHQSSFSPVEQNEVGDLLTRLSAKLHPNIHLVGAIDIGESQESEDMEQNLCLDLGLVRWPRGYHPL